MRLFQTRFFLLALVCLISASAFATGCPAGPPCLDMNTQIKGSRLPSWGTDSGAANAYAITTIGEIGSGGVLQTGSRFMFIATHANTSASTLAVDGGSAIAIKKNVSAALASGDIALNQVIEVTYDGTNFQIVGNGALSFANISGSLSCSQMPAGTGDVTWPSGSCATTLASVVTAGSCGDTTHSCGLTYNAKGLITSATNNVISGGGGGGSSFCGTGSGTPTTIAGLWLWLDASQLSGLSDGNSVLSWTNLVCGPPVSAVYTTTPPIYKTSILNGLPIVRFAADGYFYLNPGWAAVSRECSAFFVLKMSSLSNAYTGIFIEEFNSSNFGYFVKSNGKTAFYAAGANYDGTGAATLGTSVFQIMTLILSVPGITTRAALASDFTSASQSFNQTGSDTRMDIGNDVGFSGRKLTGDIAEVLVYQRGLRSTERDTIENYLKVKYGL